MKKFLASIALTGSLAATPAFAWGELDVLCYTNAQAVVATVDVTTHHQIGILPFPPLVGSPVGPVGQIVAMNVAVYGLGSWFALTDEGGTEWWQGAHQLVWRNGAVTGKTKLTITGTPTGMPCQPYGQMMLSALPPS